MQLTSTAWRSLDQEAQKRGISRSEVIEHFARGLAIEPEIDSDGSKAGLEAELALLRNQVLELQQEMGALQCQKQELESRLQNVTDEIAQATERKAVTILESITDAFVAFDRDWRYSYVNQAAAQILHKTPADLIGKHVWNDVFPELVGGIAYQLMHRVVTEQVPTAWEEFGESVQRWLEVNAYPAAEGIAVYFRDVTERKQVEAERERLLHELEIERVRFEIVLRQMPAGVLIADALTDMLVLANEQAKQIVKYDFAQSYELEDYGPIAPFEAFWPDGRKYAVAEYPLVRSLKMGEVITNEVMDLKHEDDSHTIISVNSSPILDKQGQVLAAVVVLQDITARQQTEMLLRQQTIALENQQKWLQAVLDLMPTPTVFIEPETAKVIFANRIANELAGGDFPKNKSLDEYADAYYCTDLCGQWIQPECMPLALVARGERLENYEMNWHTPGGIRSTLCRGDMLPAMHGHPAMGIAMFQDVTHLKQIEENLRQTEERLQLALSSAQMIAWDRDLITNQVVCSPNALGIWGMQIGIVDDFYAVVHPADRQQVRQAVEAAMVGDRTFSQEYRVMGASGAIRWLKSQGRVYCDEIGQATRMTGVSVDITERKQIEAERDHLLEQEQTARRLAENERQRLREILMQVPAMFAVLSGPDHVFELANPTFLTVSGRSETIIGQSAKDVFPEIADQDYFDVHDRVFQMGEVVRGDEYMSRWYADGSGNWVEGFFNLVFLPLRNIDGCIDSILIHGIEVTAQVRARRQVEALLAELQRKERQQQFLIELNDAMRAIQDSQEIMWQVVNFTGHHFNVSRCTYGEIDSTQKYVIIDRDYCNGVTSVVGRHRLHVLGTATIAALKQGKTIVVADADRDPRTAGEGAANLDTIQTKALLIVPLVKEGRFVALLALHHWAPRQWTEEDVALMESVAEKTWLAVERSRVEEKLREREAHLQLAVRIGRMGSWDWDIQTGGLLWSEGHFTVLGLQPHECEPSYEVWARHVHPADLAEAEAKLQWAMHERTEYHHEYRMLWSDGSIHWVEARGQFTYDLQGHPKHSIGAVIDITERKHAEQEREKLLERERLARSQAEVARRFQQFLAEASAVLASSLDYQTTLEQVARLTVPELADWCIIHIREDDGRIGQIAVAHVDSARLEWAHQIQAKYPLDPNAERGAALTLRTGQSDFVPEIPDELLVYAARDPEHLEILRQVGFSSFMSVPLRIQGRTIGVISFISAESGRRYTPADVQLAEELAYRASLAIDNAKLYQAAQHDRAKAETANRIKDEFLAVLSHELRSPLNPILGWTRMLRGKKLDATKTAQALETIERNARLQAQLIEDLLDVSRILQGKMTLHIAAVDLTATIKAALETVRLSAEAKRIHIQTTAGPIAGNVLGDANRLQQIIWNLLSNAVKFTPTGGQVAITLEQVGVNVQICIKDTGKGISADFLPHVFDYFRQEDGTITRRFGGLGLGLAIVRQLTELHGGTIAVESPGPNLGATFTVCLPLNLIAEKPLTPVEPLTTATDLTNVQVLVVDDDADMRDLAFVILSQAGARVITAASAMQALHLLNQAVPDLLLCDIGMPEMDGYALMRQIRQRSPEQGG